MKVLITGGSGLIGHKLTKKLLDEGIEVVHLTRHKNSKSGVKTFVWNWENETIDLKCFKGVTHIVHLAGANISDKPWTMKRKRFLIKSRVETTRLLSRSIYENDIPIKAFISASGIGYYGAITSDTIYSEKDSSNDDFISKCSVFWEEAADLFNNKCRVVKVRTGVVLDKEQGALPKITSSIKSGLGAPLGKGDQYMPWIHIDDIVNLYYYALKEDLEGIYNAVASQHITNKELTYSIAKTIGRKIRLPKIPGFLIKMIYGEMANIILLGSRVSNSKIKKHGFKFEYDKLNKALKDIYK